MERTKRRRTSSEARFELNAGLSVFKQSFVSFSNINQHLIPDVLAGFAQEVAFSYNQVLSLAFESSTGSCVPPVYELFGGVIGCYRYIDTPRSTQDSSAAPLPATRPSSSPQASSSLHPEQRPTREQRNDNSSTVLHTVPLSNSNENEAEFDWREMEATLAQFTEF